MIPYMPTLEAVEQQAAHLATTPYALRGPLCEAILKRLTEFEVMNPTQIESIRKLRLQVQQSLGEVKRWQTRAK